MKHISIIVPRGEAVVSSIVGSHKIFRMVNNLIQQHGQMDEPPFKIDLVGIGSKEEYYDGIYCIKPTAQIKDIHKTDLIIVTTVFGDFPLSMKMNKPFIEWIKNMRAEHNCDVGSLCTGAFLLAETGLLDGKDAATHWMAHDAFREKYPQVNLMPEKVITEDNGIYTSGGAYSFLNLLLYLVEKYCGKEIAITTAKIFEIDFNRSDQNQFIIFKGQKEHNDELVKDAQSFIEENFSDKISVEGLANRASLSRRNFVRRFKKATSNTPIEYIQRVKMEAAKKSFENSGNNINEVMYSVGYNDTKAFRNIFRKITGLTPSDYKLRYNRHLN